MKSKANNLQFKPTIVTNQAQLSKQFPYLLSQLVGHKPPSCHKICCTLLCQSPFRQHLGQNSATKHLTLSAAVTTFSVTLRTKKWDHDYLSHDGQANQTKLRHGCDLLPAGQIYQSMHQMHAQEISGLLAGNAYCSVRSSVAATAVIDAARLRRLLMRTALCCARRSTKQDTKDGRLVQFDRLTGVTDAFCAAQGFKVPFTRCNAPAICCALTCQQFLKVSCQLLQGLRRVESKAKFPKMRHFVCKDTTILRQICHQVKIPLGRSFSTYGVLRGGHI